MAKKLYWVKHYVEMGCEGYVYADDGEAEDVAEGLDMDLEPVDDYWETCEVDVDDLEFINEDDIWNTEDKDGDQ